LTLDLTKRYDTKQITPEKFLDQRYTFTNEPCDKSNWISINALHQEYIKFDGAGTTNKDIALNSFSRKIQEHMSNQGVDPITQRMETIVNGKKQKCTIICNLKPSQTLLYEHDIMWLTIQTQASPLRVNQTISNTHKQKGNQRDGQVWQACLQPVKHRRAAQTSGKNERRTGWTGFFQKNVTPLKEEKKNFKIFFLKILWWL